MREAFPRYDVIIDYGSPDIYNGERFSRNEKKSIESITYQTLRKRCWYVCLAQLTRWQLIHFARKLQPCSSQKSLRQVFRPQQILNEVVVGHQWFDSLCPGWRYMDKDLILSNHKPKQCCFICNEVIIGANFRHTCIWLRTKTSV